jgi:hypothetical protein
MFPLRSSKYRKYSHVLQISEVAHCSWFDTHCMRCWGMVRVSDDDDNSGRCVGIVIEVRSISVEVDWRRSKWLQWYRRLSWGSGIVHMDLGDVSNVSNVSRVMSKNVEVVRSGSNLIEHDRGWLRLFKLGWMMRNQSKCDRMCLAKCENGEVMYRAWSARSTYHRCRVFIGEGGLMPRVILGGILLSTVELDLTTSGLFVAEIFLLCSASRTIDCTVPSHVLLLHAIVQHVIVILYYAT